MFIRRTATRRRGEHYFTFRLVRSERTGSKVRQRTLLNLQIEAPSVPRGSGRETKTTREILGTIDADALRAALVRGGTRRQIEANRNRIAALLGLCEEWKRPDEVYADEAWEICIVWRSGYGRVEIGTEEDGSVGYYVSRTLSEESREGGFREHSREELDRVMSWLEEAYEEI